MSAAVEQVLDRRGRQPSRRPAALSLGAALLIHAVILAVALLLPRLSPPPKPIEFVPVTLLPAQALGVPRPAPPRPEPAREPTPPAPEPEAPTPPAPTPTPAVVKEPEPEPPPREKAPVFPEPKRQEPKPAPRPSRTEPAPIRPMPRPATPTPPTQAPSTETGDQAGRRGGATGTALGTTAFGGRVQGIDPDFTYGYYIDRLLSAIDGNWARPRVDGSVRTVVSFRIQRDGSLADPPTIKETSGYNAFDLAALRAVQNAAPFPPLPRGYRNDSLNVSLIVR